MTTKVNENSVKTHIEIEGAILSPQALSLLRDWQENDNHMINEISENIADAISLIVTNEHVMGEDLFSWKALITDLSFIRGYFKNFKKP